MEELGYPAGPDTLPRRLERLNASDNAIARVAERDGKVVGLVTAHALASLHVDEYVGWITMLVVSGDARSEGIGRRLVQTAEEWAGSKGCARVSVASGLHRVGAHEFYDRLGYLQSGLRYTKSLS